MDTASLNDVSKTRNYLDDRAYINNLPPELLIKIFRFLLQEIWKRWDEGYERYPTLGSPHNLSSWTTVLHVCHDWRNLIFKTPLLWSRMHLDDAKFAREYNLTCSDNVPLHLSLSKFLPGPVRLLGEIAQMERVESLDMRIPFDLNHQIVVPNFRSINFNIRRLGILCDLEESELSTIFIDCSFPALRVVIILGTIAELPPSLLRPSLKLLKLSLNSTGIGALDTDVFICALSQMSQLEHLILEGAVLRKRKLAPNSAEGPEKKLLLPALCQLDLMDSCSWITESIPQHEDLSELLALLSATDHDDDDDNYRSLFEMLELPSITHMCLVFRTPLPTTSYRMPTTFWQALHRCLKLSMCRSLLLRRRTQFTWDMWLLNKINLEEKDAGTETMYHARLYGLSVLQDISENLNLEYIETICTSSALSEPDKEEDWEKLLEKCPHVKSLVLNAVVAYPLIKILSEPRYLRHLELISLGTVFWNSEGPVFHHNLEKLVKTRNETGVPIRKMMIDGCIGVSAKEVSSLRRLGIEVSWNEWARS